HRLPRAREDLLAFDRQRGGVDVHSLRQRRCTGDVVVDQHGDPPITRAWYDVTVLARLALAIARTMSTTTLQRLVDVVFVPTRRELERAVADPRAAQERRLRTIVAANADTEFGRAHGIASITGLDGYRAKVPLCRWDDVEPLVARMVNGERG